ncbi:Gfo/Idh/MocA family oxidoreductase [Prosthecobacter sp.]|uniref:Gfo/Idh/MocA family protein n=1 Tax=Prosthecobacter sp. TaxID=1965333 RepID=UPI002ABC979D|nr:Gfo/Idh/MocA family oxidoreductase [Prosthecobacter sp.]MDZ4406034.1 Gfo/Idh/MocA family oxidoreductase [Prosthecobacter sp.]
MKHLLLALLLCGTAIAQDGLKQLRAGIVGLDTSHVPAFTKLFNKGETEGELAGIKVTTGYTGGTDMPASATRKEKFTQQLRDMGVEIVDSIPKLLEKVDVILLESVDGRIHLKEAREIFKAGKPVFIDKPLAGTLAEAIAIVELAKKHNVPFFSSSSSRFGPELMALKGNAEVGDILGAATWGPCSYQEGTPDFFFYGIHGVEALYTIMGTGCETVSRVKGANNDIATGTWKDGRIGAYRGIVKGKADFGAVAYGSKSIGQAAKAVSYEGLCRQIGKFFRSGTPPVSAEETIEIFTFMEAADESLRQGGKPVSLADVLAKAKVEAEKLLK